jgi:hypothetical protein
MKQAEFNERPSASANKQFVKISIIILFLFYAAIAVAENGNVSAYKGNFSGEWSGEANGMPVNGTFSVSISDDGKVAGSFSGFVEGTISGTINASGEIKAHGSAGLGEWVGNITSSSGALSGSGSWTGYGGGGTWSSK